MNRLHKIAFYRKSIACSNQGESSRARMVSEAGPFLSFIGSIWLCLSNQMTCPLGSQHRVSSISRLSAGHANFDSERVPAHN